MLQFNVTQNPLLLFEDAAAAAELATALFAHATPPGIVRPGHEDLESSGFKFQPAFRVVRLRASRV